MDLLEQISLAGLGGEFTGTLRTRSRGSPLPAALTSPGPLGEVAVKPVQIEY